MMEETYTKDFTNTRITNPDMQFRECLAYFVEVWARDAHRSWKQSVKDQMHFLSATRFFSQKKVSYEINGENMVSIRRSKKVSVELHDKKCKREESLYIALTETKQIAVENRNVKFCPHFKYLGSWCG